ncbi:MAG: DUF354 domain-containing protein [Candidatus Methanoperedens sp.]|nr:DUF354 domain-containing protein [Candidatus Methanoperedens sp.]MCZ7370614.1 DUF354 domain-containing protein [Candidatus Methanoperedens sp.]
MRILIDIGHPAHVHFFKNTIWALEKHGHEVMVTARDKDVAIDLLKAYNIPHIVLTTMGRGKIGLMKEWLIRDYKLLILAKEFKPDILTGILNPCAAHVSKLLGKKAIIFNDTEHATFAEAITYPFTDVIITPSCFKKSLGKKQVRYNGYHELAYLHPDYFKPDPAVLDELGLSKEDIFIILRFVTWGASHDVGQHGIQNKIRLVKELEKYGRVYITSEGRLDNELENYKIKVPPEKIHDLLYYATLYMGEGATMATESAILGTPAIYVSSLAGTMGNFIELEQKYGLMFNYNDSDIAIKKAVELIQKPEIKREWNEKRETLLKDKINVTGFMVRFLEDFPMSLEKIKDEILG